MTLTTHAVVGAAAASLFPEHPYLAFTAGFASHFALDALPHWDYGHYLSSMRWDAQKRMHTDMVVGRAFWRDLSIIGADAFLGFLLTFAVAKLLGVSPEMALVGAGAGIFPDFLQFVYFKIQHTPFERMLRYLQKFHVWVQKGREMTYWGWRKGLVLQAITATLALVAALLFS
jgi:hypothetical protein